jgi:hypothetical protein
MLHAEKGGTITIKSKLRLYSSTRRINGFDFHVQNTHEEGDRVTVTVPLGMQLTDIIHTLRFISQLIESDFPREARRLKKRAARVRRAALDAQLKAGDDDSSLETETQSSSKIQRAVSKRCGPLTTYHEVKMKTRGKSKVLQFKPHNPPKPLDPSLGQENRAGERVAIFSALIDAMLDNSPEGSLRIDCMFACLSANTEELAQIKWLLSERQKAE